MAAPPVVRVPRLRPVQVRAGSPGEGGPAPPALGRVQGDPPQAQDRQGRLRHQGPSRHPVPGGRRPGQGHGPVPRPRGQPRLPRPRPAAHVRGPDQGARHRRATAAPRRQVDVDRDHLDAQTQVSRPRRPAEAATSAESADAATARLAASTRPRLSGPTASRRSGRTSAQGGPAASATAANRQETMTCPR